MACIRRRCAGVGEQDRDAGTAHSTAGNSGSLRSRLEKSHVLIATTCPCEYAATVAPRGITKMEKVPNTAHYNRLVAWLDLFSPT